ncbi:hypothetical protein RchiOBHm_Chr5g0053971 [Rosa chinensis]|uniref:Uncharacterized protein n=2 Tax=Rosa chinensis TaxID=74649 RepID=A0A2P6QG16_ROSCH|nr:hypothetical protein RchiOBHm_Chr5g0053971 [Rosa chinensis]
MMRESVWGYLPFDTIIERLSKSGSPPPSVCLVKFEIEFNTGNVWSNEITDEGPPMQSCGVHVVNDCKTADSCPPFSIRELKIDAEETDSYYDAEEIDSYYDAEDRLTV